MAIKFGSGQLVEATADMVASYSNYGGRPPMSFRKGMLGVVRIHHEAGVQVEFFSPETGSMEACHCDPSDLKKLKWPDGLVDLREKYDPNAPSLSLASIDWWFCGSMGPKSAINYLRAIAILNRGYLVELGVDTLRIPGYHDSRQRSAEPVPQCFLGKCAGEGFLRAREIQNDLDDFLASVHLVEKSVGDTDSPVGEKMQKRLKI